jgi:predicted transcriptional regulator
MSEEAELDILLSLNGASYEAARVMTYKIGSVGEFMRWTKHIITDPDAVDKASKRWFDSVETAEKAFGTKASPEAMVKLLSFENLKLLHLIGTRRPGSVRELAMLVRRKESNLSRTLRKLHEAGLSRSSRAPDGRGPPAWSHGVSRSSSILWVRAAWLLSSGACENNRLACTSIRQIRHDTVAH